MTRQGNQGSRSRIGSDSDLLCRFVYLSPRFAPRVSSLRSSVVGDPQTSEMFRSTVCSCFLTKLDENVFGRMIKGRIIRLGWWGKIQRVNVRSTNRLVVTSVLFCSSFGACTCECSLLRWEAFENTGRNQGFAV